MHTNFTFGILAGLFLAISNGANDNFKGVATLLGSKTATYKTSLIWAAATTLAGSIAAFFFAQKLMQNFSGKGLVPDQVAQMTSFASSVAMSAAATVFFATRLGLPISTTHALTGALVGTGLLASPSGVQTEKLFSTFFLPLLLSPLLAILATAVLYPAFSSLRRRIGITRESGLCLTPSPALAGINQAALQVSGDTALNSQISLPELSICAESPCTSTYAGKIWGINAKSLLNAAHFLSAGLVSFARGLNDTPKIAAVLLAGSAVSPLSSIGITAAAIAVGGTLFVKRIANTMAYQITEMNDGQGLSANLVTSMIVIGASQLGMPVSTTHVSCGSLFGIGSVTKQAKWNSILKIVAAWVITLPIAALLGILSFKFLR